MEEENVKKHIHQIIGITDDERVLAECNLIEEILNKENKLSQYYKQKERIDKAIEYIEERKNLNWYADGVFVYELLNILEKGE